MNLIVSGKTRPYLECFPPTERAAGFHIVTVHLQILQWKSIMSVCLHPEDYSWRKYTTGVYSVICLSVGGNDLHCANQTPAHVVSDMLSFVQDIWHLLIRCMLLFANFCTEKVPQLRQIIMAESTKPVSCFSNIVLALLWNFGETITASLAADVSMMTAYTWTSPGWRD